LEIGRKAEDLALSENYLLRNPKRWKLGWSNSQEWTNPAGTSKETYGSKVAVWQ
jgi:hypothetical protein